MTYIKRKIDFLGIDESSLAIGSDSIIVVAAETQDKKLTESLGYNSLKKAKDYLLSAYSRSQYDEDLVSKVNFPSLESMRKKGLKNFHWTRAKGGRFSRQLIEHASIAHVVAVNGYKPDSTVLLIDAFNGNDDMSLYLLKEFLHRRGFKIPMRNIELHGGGDRSVPIINYADLLAFQIGLFMNEKYRRYFPKRKRFPVEPHEIPYDEKRVISVNQQERSELEQIVKNWKANPISTSL